MNSQNNETFSHDSDVDVVHKYNSIELKGWVNQLEYINTEIDNLLKLKSKAIQNNNIPDAIDTAFSICKKDNALLYETVLKYSNTYFKAAECDDIQCDMAYLEEYERLRANYKTHLDSYRKLKDKLYNM